jgi:predicted ATPase/class 3 adenylate cyclase
MAGLPSGIVTFLFTDIERSTEMVAAFGDRYTALLEQHHRLLRDAIAHNGGVEVGTEGDAFFVAFASPVAAVGAAADAQRALQAERWPDGGELRVRIGLHTGEGVQSGDTYVGLDVHRASRIASAAHGGQILISDATRALADRSLPDGAELRDLGLHRLKGLPGVERIFQLTLGELPSDFPPINSLEVRPNNLPAQVTSFVGREAQIRDVRQHLVAARLLTLTGPGGTGKTRLALRVAEEVIADHEHGCWFVPLDALRDPTHVPSAIATVLAVKIPADQGAMAALESWVATRELLLVLDNFEQVSEAADDVARLLSAGPDLHVLVTSRVPLHIYGEQEYPVPPLATVAVAPTSATVESLSQYEAVRLFIERAVSAKPGFRVTNANAPAVAEICARLDGLPLAIELAAARVKLLTPEEINTRLDRSLSLLASAARDLPERQRTLLSAIAWSHDLLGESEQRLFARLSVFRGGFALDAAESVCGDDTLGMEAFDGIASLFDKSLLTRDERATEARFTMLQTIREYARERLAAAGELDDLMRRHAAYFFSLAAEAGRHLAGPDQREWLDRLEREIDNLRAAFSRHGHGEMLDEALSAAGAIWRFWQLRGHFAEARSLFERLLAQPGGGTASRARALTGAGGIAYWQSDFATMARHYREAREVLESVGSASDLAEALYNESYVPLLVGGDFDGARELIGRAIELYRESGNAVGAAEAQSLLGFAHYFEGDTERAIPFQEEAIATFRAAGARWHLSDNLMGLGGMYAQVGDWQRAVEAIRESLATADELGIEIGLAMVFEFVGAAAAWLGDAELASRLMGKADEMRERLGGSAPSVFAQRDRYLAKVREELGDRLFEQLLAEGRRLSKEDAVALALRFAPPSDAPPLPRPTPWGKAAQATEGDRTDVVGEDPAGPPADGTTAQEHVDV